uniref:Uncharacterized protein n=1 Tax=Trichinella nativa TaxID=6335 RepID=A0A0V1KID1_9BILA
MQAALSQRAVEWKIDLYTDFVQIMWGISPAVWN